MDFCNIFRRLPLSFVLVGLTGILLASCYAGMMLGYLNLSASEVLAILAYQITGMVIFPFDIHTVPVVWELRMPRIILAACVGMGLTLSGIVMQAVVRNPLADPYILGISSGASLGAVCAIFLGAGARFGAEAIGVCAFAGAFILSLIVIFMAGTGRKRNPVHLLLCGMALNAACSGFTSLITYLGANVAGMEAATYWLMGSIAYAKLDRVLVLLLAVLVIFGVFCTQFRMLNLMLAGESTAILLGRRLRPLMNTYVVINAVLVGMIVTNSGMVGFIGLLVPHLVRILTGANHRILVPVAVLLGGCLVVWVDILSRIVVRGVDIPLGTILALAGAPLLILLAARKSYHFGDEKA
jgi:iron complex transport system permease protein